MHTTLQARFTSFVQYDARFVIEQRQSSSSGSTTIPLTAVLNQSSLLKYDYKLNYLKLCKSSIIMILFFIMRITVVGNLVSKYSFTISVAFCFDVATLKPSPSSPPPAF